jgi:hypothetical protein
MPRRKRPEVRVSVEWLKAVQVVREVELGAGASEKNFQQIRPDSSRRRGEEREQCAISPHNVRSYQFAGDKCPQADHQVWDGAPNRLNPLGRTLCARYAHRSKKFRDGPVQQGNEREQNDDQHAETEPWADTVFRSVGAQNATSYTK